MGKKDNKKKGKGAAKTAAKTEKNTSQKIKKDLKAKGEEDIDTLLAKFAEDDRKKQEVVEQLCKQPPSKRSAFSLTPHPDKDLLIMFGGEHFNGTKALLFSDLLTYNMKQDRWLQIIAPGGPPPRCSHQAISTQQCGGQLWVFGGEFTSESQSQFYHYKDLWVYSIAEKTWQKIQASGGPSSRSGHRMVLSKKKLFVFGGFNDNGYIFKYFNDVHVFDLENYKWHKLQVTGKAPEPRSACGLAALSDGRVLVYGGFSKQKQQGDKEDLGVAHTDMFHLVPDKHDTSGLKYKWVSIKQTGDVPTPPRCSFSFSACSLVGQGGWGEDKAVLFGGVNDDGQGNEDDDVEGQFFDELYLLDMTKGSWSELFVTGKQVPDEDKKKRRRKKSENEGSEEDREMDVTEKLDDLKVKEQQEASVKTVVTDGIFTLTVTQDATPNSSKKVDSKELGASLVNRPARDLFVPPPRISGGITVKKGSLYLYGGLYEEGERQLTLNDFYSLDLSKLEEWRIIKPLDRKDLEWFESDSEDDSENDDDEDMDSD